MRAEELEKEVSNRSNAAAISAEEQKGHGARFIRSAAKLPILLVECRDYLLYSFACLLRANVLIDDNDAAFSSPHCFEQLRREEILLNPFNGSRFDPGIGIQEQISIRWNFCKVPRSVVTKIVAVLTSWGCSIRKRRANSFESAGFHAGASDAIGSTRKSLSTPCCWRVSKTDPFQWSSASPKNCKFMLRGPFHAV